MTDATTALALPYVRLIAEQIARMGAEVDEWLALSGLTLHDLDDPDFVLDVPTFHRLGLDALMLTGEPALGLLLGRRWGVQAHGALGHAAMSSGTIREVLALVQRYIRLRMAFLALTVEPHPHEVRVVLTEVLPLDEVRGMVLEAVIASIKGTLDDISMGACQVQSVAFPFQAPAHASHAATILRCPVHYGQDWAGFTLSPHLLDVPLKTSDPAAFRLAEALCERELRSLEAGRSWTTRVQRILLETRAGFPSLEETARRVHVTPRTLHRRLVEEDSSYRAILDALRHRIALDQLTAGDATIQEVAYILGYSNPANFRRAFRRWTGQPPSAFRGP